MKLYLKWFLTGNISVLDESDELLGPQTTIWEIKGLVQGRFTYSAKNLILIHNRRLLENHEVLANCTGIFDQATADQNEITIHMLSDEELEGDNLDEDDGKDVNIHEYNHQDFIKVCEMLGKNVPVAEHRMMEVKKEAPRTRPAFLNQPMEGDSQQQGAAQPSSDPPKSAYDIFRHGYHGLRADKVDKELELTYPGVAEPYTFWDVRPSETHMQPQNPGEICLDLFFFGEIEPVDSNRFAALATEKLQQKGFRITPIGNIREAGCMYPLIAVPVIMADPEALQFGSFVFEHFGKPLQPVRAAASGAPPESMGQPGQKPPPCVIQ